jgi:hypothetical protein
MMKRFGIVTFLVSIVVVVMIAYYFGKYSNQEIKTKAQTVRTEKAGSRSNINCSRTTRLDNEPHYDRALSLVAEKSQLMRGTGLLNEFDKELVNCIKITTSDVHSENGAEGFFVFNDKDIRKDYFPITIDESYDSADDLITAILLTHEITHVQQFINQLNEKEKLSCIDKEVHAFYAQDLLLAGFNSEERKSVDYRIEHDDDLNPQLQTVQAIREAIPFLERHDTCINSTSDETTNCLREYDLSKIKPLVLQSSTYQKECYQ